MVHSGTHGTALRRSRHVADLRLIFPVTVIMMLVGVIAALAFCFDYGVVNDGQKIRRQQADGSG